MSGTIDNPAEFKTALASARVIPGDTLWLRGGTYAGVFTCLIRGDADHRTTIRPYPGETVIIDGGLIIGTGSGDAGSYVTIRGLLIKNSKLNRGTWETPDGTPEIIRAAGISVMAHHVEVINNVIIDAGVGIGWWPSGYAGVCYGNVVNNSGWADDNQGGAESLYIQGNGMTVKHNIFGPAFKRTFAAYGNNEAITGSTFYENIIFARQGALFGSGNVAVNDLTVNANHIIGNCLLGGYTYKQNGSAVITNNRVYGAAAKAWQWSYFLTLTANNNVFSGGGQEPNYEIVSVQKPADITGLAWSINSNAYHYTGAADPFGIEPTGFGNFAEWQALGHDAASTYSASLPSANEIFIFPNDYPDANDARLGIVVIWNWVGDNTVTIDLTSLNLDDGNYLWRNAQDPLSDTGALTVSSDSASFPMTGHTVAKPIGFDEELMANQFPTFGCFVVDKA